VTRDPEPADQLTALFRQRSPRRNADAVERTIRALRSSDRIEDVDAGLIAAARTTARALDHAPSPYVAGTVARVHLEALRLLAGRPAPESDEIDAFLSSLRRPAAVRDSSHT
jgi:hypothetical protein